MGKEWLYRGGGGGKPTKKGRSRGGAELGFEAATPGCMCAVFQLFHLHHFQFPAHHPPSLKPDNSFLQDDESTVLKGVEAPRNSLELEETNFMGAASLSSTMIMKEEENLNIPMGIQIKTSVENRSPRASTSSSKAKGAAGEDVYSECSSSSPAGTKTPNLVARLMGLDLLPLPESGSPSALSISSRRHSISNSITNSHPHLQHHPQGQIQYSAHRSRQFIQSRSSCIGASSSSFFDTTDTSTTGTSGTLSLPETPRISSASRRSDVDHRLSLQINVKEKIAEEFELSLRKINQGERRKRREIKGEDENRSPAGHYARQIVKQVRESVSRKVGADITNTIKSRDDHNQDHDHDHDHDHVVLLKPKKPSSTRLLSTRVSDDHETSPASAGKHSCSPRLWFLDPKNKSAATPTPVTKNPSSNSPRLSPLHLTSPALENQSQLHQVAKVPSEPAGQHKGDEKAKQKKCKKLTGTERYVNSRLRKPPQASDHAIRNKKEEPFVIRSTSTTNKANVSRKKKKKSLSNELFNISVPNLLQVKKLVELDKQSRACEGVSRERRRKARLSSCSSRSYMINLQEEETRTLGFQENIQRLQRQQDRSSTSVDEEYRMYIERILKRTGIVDKTNPVSQAKWFSQSHPLDPSIFHYIELFHPTTTAIDKLTRKLIFKLVDELLVDILKPNYYYINLNPWIRPFAAGPLAVRNHRIMDGSDLIETLCARIGNFPAANCEVLEDIDALIEKDLYKSQHSLSEEEEGEGLVSYIEREIVESLVHETAVGMFGFGFGFGMGTGPSVQCHTYRTDSDGGHMAIPHSRDEMLMLLGGAP